VLLKQNICSSNGIRTTQTEDV